MALARSLKQAVEQAQQNVTDDSRRLARFVDSLQEDNTPLRDWEERQALHHPGVPNGLG